MASSRAYRMKTMGIHKILSISSFPHFSIYFTSISAMPCENQIFAYAKSKTPISCAITAQPISIFVFTSWIVQSLFFLYKKFLVFFSNAVSDLIGSPKGPFSRDAAHVSFLQAIHHILLCTVKLSLQQPGQLFMK